MRKLTRTGSIALSQRSTTGPSSPPTIANNNSDARSMAFTCKVGSTPRSKRYDESVLRPHSLARPATAFGVKWALSKKIDCVLSVTAEAKPPMIPAIAIGLA